MIKFITTITGFVIWLGAGIALLIWSDSHGASAKVGTDGASGSMIQWIGAGIAISGLLGLLYTTGLLRALVGAAVAWRQSAPPIPPPNAGGPHLDSLAPPNEHHGDTPS